MILKPGWDTFIFAVPFIGMLLVGFFRLDEAFASHKRSSRARLPASGVDRSGRQFLRDPDGRPWRPARGHK
jgi:hypothetical protein